MQKIAIERITIENDLQPRLMLNEDHIQGIVEALRANPNALDEHPLTVWKIGETLVLVDGFHRFQALTRIQATEVPVEIRQSPDGGNPWRDALVSSIESNLHKGAPLKRSREDNRKAVQMLLKDVELRKWSDRKIAEKVGVSDKTVADVRAENSDWQAVNRVDSLGRAIKIQIDDSSPVEQLVRKLPLYNELKGIPRGKFLAAAKIHFEFQDSLLELGKRLESDIARRSIDHRSKYMRRLMGSFKILSPDQWVKCENCKGEGQIPKIGNCHECYGDGYLISTANS